MVGLMGSGKSTIAAGLASRLGWELVDSDAQLAARFGRSAADIAATEDLDRLHDLEASLLLEALNRPGPSVIAAAASTIERPECRAALLRDDVIVVWLRAGPRVAAKRAAAGLHRPRSVSSAAALRAQATARNPLYEATADLVVDTDRMAPEAIIGRVAALRGASDAGTDRDRGSTSTTGSSA
jgi:shikimate kinase